MFVAVDDSIAQDITNLCVALITASGVVGAAIFAVRKTTQRNQPNIHERTAYAEHPSYDKDVDRMSGSDLKELVKYMRSDILSLRAELKEKTDECQYLLTQVK